MTKTSRFADLAALIRETVWTKKRVRGIAPRVAWSTGLECLETRAMLSADFFPLAEGLVARDQGFDPATEMTYLVGQMAHTDGTEEAMLLRSTDLLTFQSDVLVGLGPDTEARGIAADGSRVSGFSKSPGSVSIGEGATWLSSSPSSPVGIGFVDGFTPTSGTYGAWSGGVVGDHSGGHDAVKWSASSSELEPLPDGGGGATSVDVTSDGLLMVGAHSTASRPNGVANYWDSDGIHVLNDLIGIQSGATSVSPNGNFIGGVSGYFQLEPFETGAQAIVWSKDGSSYDPTLLTWEDGTRVVGKVVDISNSGYAVVALTDGGAAIYSAEMGTVSMADFVALHGEGAVLPDLDDPVVAIAEIGSNTLQMLFESFLVRLSLTQEIIPTILGSDGSDSFRHTIGAGETLRIIGGGGSDHYRITLSGPDARLVIDGGDGSDRIYVNDFASGSVITVNTFGGNDYVRYNARNAVGGSTTIDLGEGNDRLISRVRDSESIKLSVSGDSGDDRFYGYVRSSDDAVLGFDLGDGSDRFSQRVYLSDRVELGVLNGSGNAVVSLATRNTTDLQQAVVLGDGNHRVRTRHYDSENMTSYLDVGLGTSSIYQYDYRATNSLHYAVIGDGRSRYTARAIRSTDVVHNVTASDSATRVSGSGSGGTTGFEINTLTDSSSFPEQPNEALDSIFAQLGMTR